MVTHTNTTGHTLILMVTHTLSYLSQTHPIDHTPIILVTQADHTPILLVTPVLLVPYTYINGHTPILMVTHTLILFVANPYYWSHPHPTRHTPIILGAQTHLIVKHKDSHYWARTHPAGQLPILLVTHPSYWSHTTILLVTDLSYLSHIHPTGHTPVLLVTHHLYWLHTNPTGHIPIQLLVTNTFY